MTKSKRVLILWIIILACFGVFTAAFWPLHFYQQTQAPENFMLRAEELYAQGDTEAAADVVLLGIQQFRPPFAEPYQRLGDFYEELGEITWNGGKRIVAFYDFIHGGERDLSSYFKDELPRLIKAGLHGSMNEAFVECAKTLAQATQIPWPDTNTAQFWAKEWLELGGMNANAFGKVGFKGPTIDFEILVQSWGGEGDAALARIYVDGKDYALPGNGLQVVVVHPDTGDVIGQQVFDMATYEQEADRLVQFLDTIEAGTIGIFAMKGALNDVLPEAAEEALESFGIQKYPLIEYEQHILGPGFSFAAAGAKGMEGRSKALQVWSPASFQGYTGHPVALAILQPEEGAQ